MTIEKMKRRILHLRLLIDQSKNKKVKKEAIREYASKNTRPFQNILSKTLMIMRC